MLRFPPEKTCHPTLIAGRSSPKSKLVSQISLFCSRTRGQDWGFHAFPVASRFLCSCTHQREARRPKTPAERLREAANGHDRTHCKIVAFWRAAGVVSRVVQRPTRFANPENIAHHRLLLPGVSFWAFHVLVQFTSCCVEPLSGSVGVSLSALMFLCTLRGAGRHRGPHREAQRGAERHREAQRGTEKHREAQRGTKGHREAQGGPTRFANPENIAPHRLLLAGVSFSAFEFFVHPEQPRQAQRGPRKPDPISHPLKPSMFIRVPLSLESAQKFGNVLFYLPTRLVTPENIDIHRCWR